MIDIHIKYHLNIFYGSEVIGWTDTKQTIRKNDVASDLDHTARNLIRNIMSISSQYYKKIPYIHEVCWR